MSLKRQWEGLMRLGVSEIKLLKGTESDLIADGVLDYPDQFWKKPRRVIAVFFALQRDADKMTKF